MISFCSLLSQHVGDSFSFYEVKYLIPTCEKNTYCSQGFIKHKMTQMWICLLTGQSYLSFVNPTLSIAVLDGNYFPQTHVFQQGFQAHVTLFWEVMNL